ncbi:rod shape-determining protein RodA [Bacillus aquiflavi]|uniref:Rod shape-determining protein RodA n=1 Tax=Bacillus aquiflavi TaxID=2672567 RepID=A0A6B3VXT2_9BACI|nr:rod shape-determining protein RodA [Bacillus aquiflavi]MBA4538546.1 rod shape-determining protein RodA [Bacillus aquiflavi]NEY82909.1 rod shape-determining protein RodA [Bacillus aquiflavi]UAC49592.1 rod shape-determining protein RodA [Bacillus aquiflavi]
MEKRTTFQAFSNFRLDQSIIVCLLLLFIISLITVYSGSGQYAPSDPYFFLKRQIVWYIIGLIVLGAVMTFDYELLPNFSLILYIIGIVLLIAVYFFGIEKNGSQRWLQLGGFLLQPSEFMKIFLIIHLGAQIDKFKKNYQNSFKNHLKLTVTLFAWSIPPLLLILKQPDLGTSLVIISIVFSLLFVAGVSFKILLSLIGIGSSVIGSLVYLHFFHFDFFSKMIKPHQLERIYGWLAPEQYASSYGYQHLQAKTGIGAGQMTGLGFMNGVQSQSGRVPEVHTDFIFTVIGEEFGFIGASILISIYFILFFRMISIALEANSEYGTYIITGVIGLLAFQIFQNIGMTVGLMPITGLALPFISYGGSALLTNMIALGLVLNVRARTRKFMFSSS